MFSASSPRRPRRPGARFRCALWLGALALHLIPAVARAQTVDVRWSEEQFVRAEVADGVRFLGPSRQWIPQTGAPTLPMETLQIALPFGTRAHDVSVLVVGWENVERPWKVAPVGDVMSSEDSVPSRWMPQERATKGPGQAWPDVVGELAGTATLHGYALAQVNVYPFRVTATGMVQRATGMKVTVSTVADEDVSTLATRSIAWPGLEETDRRDVESVVVNPEGLAAAAPPRGRRPVAGQVDPKLAGRSLGKTPLIPEGAVDYLIVTTAALAGEFQRLADWKTERGLSAAVVTVEWIEANYREGADVQENIRTFLKEAYARWGAQYLLLGGDAEVLAPRYVRSFFHPFESFTDLPADLYFAALDRNWNNDGDGAYGEPYTDFLNPGDNADVVAELYTGRAPVQNLAQTQLFVDKVIEYESPTGDTSYLGRALFMSEVLFPPDWSFPDPVALDGATYSENIVFNSLVGGGNLIQSWRMYQNYTAHLGAIEETKQAASDSLSSGNFGLANHVGHGFYYNMSVGDGNIFVEDANFLSNGDHAFVLYALNCSSAAFDFDCLMENFVRNPGGGSVASIGSARAAFPTTADKYQQEYYSEIFVNGNTEIGRAMALSRLSYTGATFIDTADRWTHMTYTLLGDPAMQVWREEPVVAVVTHAGSVVLGDQTLSVGVAAGGAVAGARVALSAAGSNMVFGITDGGGNVVLDIGDLASQTGNLTLNVSGQNLLPYQATVTVGAPTGPHVVAVLSSLDDSSGAPADGDNDGQPESGETVQLFMQFSNNGNGSPANSVSAILSAISAPGATILDDSISAGTISGGGSVTPGDGFTVQLAPTVPDGEIMSFDVSISSGGSTWVQTLSLTALAPEPAVTRVRWDDSVTGNNDGIIQAGENVEILVEISNFGAGDLASVDGTLSSTSPNVTLVDATNSWQNLGLKGKNEGQGSFEITESDVGVENWITLTLNDDWGHVWTHDFELRRPNAPPNPEVETMLGPNDISLKMENVFQLYFSGFRVYRSENSGGPFAEITSTPLVNTGFYHDAGLASLTPYYYYATVVDSSAVESLPSGIVSASTSPPELPGGFPIPLGRALAGATAVGDIRGDGTLVAAMGADFLYALDANGNELVDGDNDSQTLGPLGGPPAPDDRFTPAGVALADLDNDGDDEVIGCNWITDQLYVLQNDGSNFPGWPQPISGGAWATPAVGDIDNNGDLEIVVNSTSARTYVFNHDGSDFFDGDANPGTVGVFQVRPGENFNRSTVALFDVDGDDTLEIIFGTHWRDGSDNFVHALRNDATDAPGWPRNLGAAGYNVGSISIADMDQDGIEELVFLCDDDFLYVFQPDGSDKVGFPIPFTSQAAQRDSLTPTPGFADFDNDGDLEMVVVSIIGASLSNIYLKDHDGTNWPGWPIALPGLSESSPMIGDINGDHVEDIVFGIGGGGDNDPNILYAFNADGTAVAGFPMTQAAAFKGTPVICDFDQDGDVDIVYAGFDRHLHVWDMPFPWHPWATPWSTFHGNNRRTGVFLEDVIVDVPVTPRSAEIVLHPNRPNPFNPSTTLRFEVPGGSGGLVPTTLTVYDVAGRHVRTLIAQPLAPGPHEATWNGLDRGGNGVSTGIYFAKLRAAGSVATVKMMLLK